MSYLLEKTLKKQPKKEILCKMRCIYKIQGYRKEYVKHKGELITVKNYKELIKAKKPTKSSKKNCRSSLQKQKKIIGGNPTFRTEITNEKISILMIDEKKKEVGHFQLNININPNTSSRTLSLNILIEDGYQGKGHSNTLLVNFLEAFESSEYKYDRCGNKNYTLKTTDINENEVILNGSDMLFIDTDASYNDKGESFWDRIGMKENRRCYSNYTDNYKKGYEKSISLKELLNNIESIRNNIQDRSRATEGIRNSDNTTGSSSRSRPKKRIRNSDNTTGSSSISRPKKRIRNSDNNTSLRSRRTKKKES